MKYILMILIVALTGCASSSVPQSSDLSSKTTENENCFASDKLQVLQILDKGILAHLCPIEYQRPYESAFDACVLQGDLVYMAVNPKENDYVDNQKITLPEHLCFVPAGKYSYFSNQKLKKTVRRIEIENSLVPNPEHKSDAKQ